MQPSHLPSVRPCRHLHSKLFWFPFCLALMLGYVSSAFATPEFLQLATKEYAFKKDGVVSKASCNLCHSGITNAKNLNLYGKDVQGALDKANEGKLLPAGLHSLDGKDSDGDGFPNSDEFKADTLPGDVGSKPAGPPPAKIVKRESVGNQGSFSIASTLLAKNAQHPAIVHFPIALFLFSLFLDIVGIIRRSKPLHEAAFYNLIASAVTSVLSIVTGILAWQIKLGGASLEGDLKLHLILAIVTSISLCGLWVIRFKQKTYECQITNFYLIAAVVVSILIAITGHLGGVISGVAG